MSIVACEKSPAAAELHANNAQPAQCVEDFKRVLYKMQDARRAIVAALLEAKHVDSTHLDVLRATLQELTDNRTSGEMRHILTPTATFPINIRDEIRGLHKDLEFLEKLIALTNHGGMVDDFLEGADLPSILAPFHPHNTQKFHQELDDTVRFLMGFVDRGAGQAKPMLITDWDGTMKDYCSQYATNLQPVYSAVMMGRFATQFTRLTAVLTAGPLRGPGILDLTALPVNGRVKFSGSWGREWWLGGKRVVHDFGVTEEAFDAINRLSDELVAMLANGDFAQFTLVGSGVQKKVDRLTLGVQTVFDTVPPELTARYIDALRERIHRVDPNGQVLQLDEHNRLEVEVCAHSSENGEQKVWDKGDGVEALIDQLQDSLKVGRVLVAGDTTSDLPMLRYAQSQNPQGVMALFVGASAELQSAVRSIVQDDSRVCFVSCPDVTHAAFARLLSIRTDID